MSEHLDLADWRRRTAELYAALRADTRPDPMRVIAFRAAKDRLFAGHPQSPVPERQRGGFRGLAYWRHDPALSLRATLERDPVAAPPPEVPRSGEGAPFRYSRIGWVSFVVDGTSQRLAVFWLADYAGGIFIPFRDATSGIESYAAGRYLWDSAKGADLGSEGDLLTLDFNFAYHPSCVYDARWSCPLAPRENWLPVPIRAGERLAEEHR
jgi:uncharacterized protein